VVYRGKAEKAQAAKAVNKLGQRLAVWPQGLSESEHRLPKA
jgi:hypothetical protein